MSILLTSVTCFAEPTSISRQAYVTAAFEEFHSTLNFLAVSDRFLQGLTPEERIQFDLVANHIVKHVYLLGTPAVPGQGRTSNHVDFKLRFSDVAEDFILNPGEEQRTAKMAGDIWFNLNIINNPKVKFGLLEAFQIMFHEFGHKIGEKKNQALIDSVAAKLRLHLAGYYKEAQLSPTLKISSLVLPYLSYGLNPVDYQFEPIVIVDNQGQAAAAQFEIPRLRQGTGFLESPRSQAYMRTSMTPQFFWDGNELRIDWQITNRHNLVVAERFNYMNLYSNLEKAKVDEKVEPYMEYQKLIMTVPAPELQRIANKEYHSTPFRLKLINYEHQAFKPANEKSRWLEKLKLVGQKNDRLEYSAVVESTKPVDSVLLLSIMDNLFFKFKGEVTSLGGNIYRLNFSLPAVSAHDQSLEMYAVAFNNEERWDLEEVVKVPLRKAVEARSIRPMVIGALGMNQELRLVHQVPTPLIETEKIVWRFGYADPNIKIEQIEIMWLVPENISKEGKQYGNRVRSIFEVIDKKDIRQVIGAGGGLGIEFVSAHASQISKEFVTQDGYVIADSLARHMKQLQMIDQNYNTYSAKSISLPTGWKSWFELKPKINPNLIRCESVFR